MSEKIALTGPEDLINVGHVALESCVGADTRHTTCEDDSKHALDFLGRVVDQGRGAGSGKELIKGSSCHGGGGEIIIAVVGLKGYGERRVGQSSPSGADAHTSPLVSTTGVRLRLEPVVRYAVHDIWKAEEGGLNGGICPLRVNATGIYIVTLRLVGVGWSDECTNRGIDEYCSGELDPLNG